MKKQISKKLASEKYGIIVKRFHDYKYFLLENGNVVDSDGDIRYTAPKPRELDYIDNELTAEQYEKNLVKHCAYNVHYVIQEKNDNEALDGDATQALADVFLAELNKLNGNI